MSSLSQGHITNQERPGFLMPWIVFQVIVILFGLARLVGSLVLVAFLSAVVLIWVWIVINIATIIIIIIIKNSKSSKLANMISTTKFFADLRGNHISSNLWLYARLYHGAQVIHFTLIHQGAVFSSIQCKLVFLSFFRQEIQKKKREAGNGQRSSITTIG